MNKEKIDEYVDVCYGINETIYTVNYFKISQYIEKKCKNIPKFVLEQVLEILCNLDDEQ